jgi:tRNA (adenine57-N1/adenine58-N1)-methyltransferase catalytic subunit
MINQRRGPFKPGDQVQLTDEKGRRHRLVLTAGQAFHTHRGSVAHDDLIGQPEGSVVRATSGTPYIALRPLLADYTVSMSRGAAVVYPKDAAQIIGQADIFPGARVIEAGAGSGALSCWLLRAIGETGCLVSYERRPDFADIARRNVESYFGGPHPAWRLVVGDLPGEPGGPGSDQGDLGDDHCLRDYDRVVLDLLAPWEHVGAAAGWLSPGGLICSYVATTTQLSRVVEELRAHGGFDEPMSWETLARNWHVEGLAVRPEHRMIGHRTAAGTRRGSPAQAPPPGQRCARLTEIRADAARRG